MASLLYSKRMIKYSGPRGARSRPRTFRTEEQAKAYAVLKGVKDYTIAHKRKKFVMLNNAENSALQCGDED
jgi:NAD(P)H-hydrate repair Nnr-like enzyme with NAD(P)H-hydrate dehydratase domain